MTDIHIIEGIHAPHDCAVQGMLPHDLRNHLGLNNDPLHKFYPKNTFPKAPYPTLMGHEASGTVEVLGKNSNCKDQLVFPEQKLASGDRISTVRVSGAFGEYSCIDTCNVIKLPRYMTDEEGSLLEPLIHNYNCIKRCFETNKFETIAILGQGCQGLLATQVVKALGATKIIVIEPLAHKRKLACEFGADVAIDPSKNNVVHTIEHLTKGKGVDLVLECAGVPETIQVMPYIVRRGGVIGQIGAIGIPVKFDYGYVHFKQVTVIPVGYYKSLMNISSQVKDILNYIRTGKIEIRSLITHRLPLKDINEAFCILKKQQKKVIKIAIYP